jgi:hypothetical protein
VDAETAGIHADSEIRDAGWPASEGCCGRAAGVLCWPLRRQPVGVG